MSKILGPKFFNQPTLMVARDLLGKFLVRKVGGKELALMITEVEAYDGLEDKASHASRGRTARNLPMFGPAGRWYVYLVYGNHFMLNIVTGDKDYPAAVLLRGVEGVNGPGRLTKQFRVAKSFNNKPANKKIGLWLEDRGVKIKRKEIKTGPRIGVAYAGPRWASKPYRFYLS